MAIIPQPHLFGWQEIDAASDLDRLRLVLETMPDEPLVQDLEKGRGRGRNDYPIRFVLNSLYAGVVYDHASIESLRRELQRNGELRCLCGFDPVLGATAVPSSDSYSNLLTKLLAMEDEVHAMFERLLAELQVDNLALVWWTPEIRWRDHLGGIPT